MVGGVFSEEIINELKSKKSSRSWLSREEGTSIPGKRYSMLKGPEARWNLRHQVAIVGEPAFKPKSTWGNTRAVPCEFKI